MPPSTKAAGQQITHRETEQAKILPVNNADLCKQPFFLVGDTDVGGNINLYIVYKCIRVRMTHCFYLTGYYCLSFVVLLASFPPEAVQVCQEITAFIIRKQSNDNISASLHLPVPLE